MRDQVVDCPVCEHRGQESKLVNNGGYPRSIPLGPGESYAGWIYRKYCRCCGVSFSLLPEFVLRRQRYSLTLVATWLWAWLGGASTRCRDFYRRQSVRHTEPDRMAWSDWLDQAGQRTRPGYQLLHRWAVRFSERAQLQLGNLAEACQRLQASFDGVCVPQRNGPLALAWSHWQAAVRAQSTVPDRNDHAAFVQLVRYLAREPSHVARRVSGGILSYDVLIIRGRRLPP